MPVVASALSPLAASGQRGKLGGTALTDAKDHD